MDHMIQIQNRIRDELAASYPGVFNYDRRTVAQIVGCSFGHLANLEAMGCPLIATVKVGKKLLYQLPDVIDFLVKQRATAKPRRRGSRTKAERMQAQTERCPQ
jgi:hypothetical protein